MSGFRLKDVRRTARANAPLVGAGVRPVRASATSGTTGTLSNSNATSVSSKNRRLRTQLLTVVVGSVLSLASACQSEVPKVAAVEDQAVAPRRVEPVQSVGVDRTIAQSPAATASSIDAVTSSPEALCREFLQRLQTGDRIGAEALLTREALKTTTKANLMLEPITHATSSVSVLPAVFESQRRDVAKVECWIADRYEGQTFQSKITWQVRKQAGGWRVSGMCIPLDYDAANRMLSFESIDDVATIKLLATGEATDASPDQRQADAQGVGTTMQ